MFLNSWFFLNWIDILEKTPNASMGFFNFEKVKLGALQAPDFYHYKKVDSKSVFLL